MTLRPPKEIERLYAPQFEQFGFSLEPDGCVFVGKAENELGHGSAWAFPITNSCVIVEHDITPAHDMLLAEEAPRPYACVTRMNEPTMNCAPQVGIRPIKVEIEQETTYTSTHRVPMEPSKTTTVSFLQMQQGVQNSPLKRGHTYKSRSIMFYEDYFTDLDALYPHEFDGLFESFSTPWNNEASLAINNTLLRLSPKRTTSPGARLYMKSAVDTMVAELAAGHIATRQALEREGSRHSSSLARQTCALIKKLLDEKHAPSIDELAGLLYVSRSKLCATFMTETGEGVGEYVRRQRMNRAEILLADGRKPISQIANDLDYARTSAFSQAFRAYAGVSPSVWRERQRQTSLVPDVFTEPCTTDE